MDSELLDRNKLEEILNRSGPEFLKRLSIDPLVLLYLVKVKLISHQQKEDLICQSPSHQRNTILDALYQGSILNFIDTCITLTDECNQAHLVSDVFKLSINALRAQKTQIEETSTNLTAAVGSFPGQQQPQPQQHQQHQHHQQHQQHPHQPQQSQTESSTGPTSTHQPTPESGPPLGPPQHGGPRPQPDYRPPEAYCYPPPHTQFMPPPAASSVGYTPGANTAHPSTHPPPHQQPPPTYNTWAGNLKMGSPGMPGYTQEQGLQAGFNMPSAYPGSFQGSYPSAYPGSFPGSYPSAYPGYGAASTQSTGYTHPHHQQHSESVTVRFQLIEGTKDEEHVGFKEKIQKAIEKAFGKSELSPGVCVKHLCLKNGFAMVDLKNVKLNEIFWTMFQSVMIKGRTGKNYTLDKETLTVMDPVAAAIASEIYKQQHVTDQAIDKTIDLDNQYVRLRLLRIEKMVGIREVDAEFGPVKKHDRPDYYQTFLEKCGGKDIQEEDLVTNGETGMCILMRGRAGVGKSTTMQQIFWKWAHGKWGKQFKAVFLLNIRHFLRIRTKVDLLHLLSRNSVYAPDNALTESWLEDNEEHLCLAMDGLDEIWQFKDRWNETSKDVDKPRTGLEWCFSLLQRKCLSSATIIVSSRPFANLSLIGPNKLVEVMGLTQELVMSFVERNVVAERAAYVKKTLKNNPILLSVSAITYYCAALCRVLEETDLGTEHLKTYTQINAFIIEDYMKRCLKIDDGKPVDINSSLRAISRLAYSGLVKTGPSDLTRLMFSHSEIEDLGITDPEIDLMCSSGIFSQTKLADKDQPGEGQTLGQFVHLSIQEFLAMGGYLLQDDPAARSAISAMFEAGQFVMAQLYLLGLVFNSGHRSVGTVTGRLALTEGRVEELQEDLRKEILTTAAFEGLHGMQCIHEAQCEKTAQLYAEKRLGPEVKFQSTPLTAIDFNALGFTLRHHLSSLKTLNLAEVNLDVTSLRTVMDIVNKCQHLETLILEDRTINEECLQVLDHSWDNSTLQTLVLGHGPVGDEGRTSIHNVLGKAKGISRLSLVWFDVADKATKEALNGFIHNPHLKSLQIESDLLTDEGVKDTAAALQGNTTLDTISINSVKMTDGGVLSVTQALCQNQTVTILRLDSTSITDVGVQHVAALMSATTHLEHVMLFISSIHEEGVDAILIAMDKNQTINMRLGLKQPCDPHLEERLETCDRLKFGIWP